MSVRRTFWRKAVLPLQTYILASVLKLSARLCALLSIRMRLGRPILLYWSVKQSFLLDLAIIIHKNRPYLGHLKPYKMLASQIRLITCFAACHHVFRMFRSLSEESTIRRTSFLRIFPDFCSMRITEDFLWTPDHSLALHRTFLVNIVVSRNPPSNHERTTKITIEYSPKKVQSQ